jgi:hypothetical protein
LSPSLYNAIPLIFFKVLVFPVSGSNPFIFLSNSIENNPSPAYFYKFY